LVELELNILKLFKQKLKEKAKDLTKRGIPLKWEKALPLEIPANETEGIAEHFKGFYHILDMKTDHERDELKVIAWNESNNSTWNLVFDTAYRPALEESVKIKITSGTIVKIISSRKTDKFRGTIIFDNPAIQPELVKTW
jgi:hypothetical protein